LNVIAVALVSFRLIDPQAQFFSKPVAWPFLVCGRNSLHTFCLGILLSVLGHLVLNEFFGGILMQILLSAAGIGIMIATAALLERFVFAKRTSATNPARVPTVSGGASS
jgi:hypothetical protein